MSRIAYRIGTDTPACEADDLSGKGAEITGGRWNEKGVAVVYAAGNRSLACLETLVHLAAAGLPFNRYLVEISIPDPVWAAARRETPTSLPVGWDAEPASRASIGFGTGWLRSGSAAVLVIPSVIVPEECCVLVNPAHPDSASISAIKSRRWLYDPRLTRDSITGGPPWGPEFRSIPTSGYVRLRTCLPETGQTRKPPMAASGNSGPHVRFGVAGWGDWVVGMGVKTPRSL